MSESHPHTDPRHEPERVYERAADPAETADRPLEPKPSGERLSSADEPGSIPARDDSPHHALNTPVGEPDPTADSDPYREATSDDEQDRASSTRGSGQGAEQ
ncbi:MAG: hypothetical protein M3016_10675 [Actinomycetota bacterium]|nr:hypothetical protein [Actinomycetota bacterium]